MKVLVIAHGKFASGIESSMNIIIGKVKNMDYINSYVEEIDVDKKIEEYFSLNKEVIVLTDFLGGSINQKVVKYINDNVHVISGVNLPMVLDIAIRLENNNICFEDIDDLIEITKEQITHVNKKINEYCDDEFGDME